MTDPRVDAYIAKSAEFARPILVHVRKAVHAGCPGVQEELKWGVPHFSYKGMFCGMAAFKRHCIFGFWKHKLLVSEGVIKADDRGVGQYGPITSLSDLPDHRTLVAIVKAAAKLNDEGMKVPRVVRLAKPPAKAPPYFIAALKKNKKALATFKGFSPSQKRDYVEWVADAKTGETRTRRIDQAVAWMSEGKIRNWKYVKK